LGGRWCGAQLLGYLDGSLSGLVINPKFPKDHGMVGQGSLKKDLFAVPKFGLSPRAAPAHLLAGLRPVTTCKFGRCKAASHPYIDPIRHSPAHFKRQSSQLCREHCPGSRCVLSLTYAFWSISDQIRSTSASLYLVPSAAKI